jgi:hypothetical protein
MTLTDKTAGAMLSDIGFRNRQRTNSGWILWLDSSTQARVHELVKTYDNRYIGPADVVRCSTICLASPDAVAPATAS